MSKDYYAEALKGTRKTALNILSIIEKDFERYGNSGHKDARKHQIIFSMNVLASICLSCQTLKEAAHYDIYIDIFTEILEPKLEPQASPSHWKRLLSGVEYLFLAISDYNLHAEALKLHTYISRIQTKWSDIDDWEYLLSIHGAHMQMLLKRQQKDHNLQANFAKTLLSIEELFVHMTERCRENPIDSTIILRSFINKVITKNRTIQMQLSSMTLCKEMECMFKGFFEFISINAKFESADDPCANFEESMQALYRFLQMDMYNELKYQLALKYARILRTVAIFEANEYIKYCSAILYNLLKFTYCQECDESFKKSLTLLYLKFSKLLTQSGEVFIQQNWFRNVITFTCNLFQWLQTSGENIFHVFWQQMDSPLYTAYIKCLAELTKITPLIEEVNLKEFGCCKNPNAWFHVHLMYTHIGLETYMQFLKHCSSVKSKTTSTDSLSCVKGEILTFVQQSINTLVIMENECIKSALSIRKLCITVAKILQESNQYAQAPELFSIATEMTRLKSRIKIEDWILLMSFITKNVCKTKDATLMSEILSCYIAEMICSPKHAHIMTLQRLILHHHYEKPGTSLFEIYVNSLSAFKPLISKAEKRYFHWLEMQYIGKIYGKEKDNALILAMAQRSQSKFDFIQTVHAGKLLNHDSISSKVQSIHDLLMNKKANSEKKKTDTLTRLEELTLAHTICLLLAKRIEERKVAMSNKEFHESNFIQLVEEKSLLSLSVAKEMEVIDMAREAFKAFEAFFTRADVENFPIGDGGFIDWERILEDLISLALYFQLAGYLEYAYEAWLLQYRISNTINNVQSSLRSLAFFCEHNLLFEKDSRLQLSTEVNEKIASLKIILENLAQLLKREQNYTLICVCQIAYYYASLKEFETARCLLQLVQHQHNKILNRQGSYDIVLFNADMVSFRINWKIMSAKKSEKISSNHRLLQQIDLIIERLRKYENISSADMTPYTILLLNAIGEFAEFAAIRMCDDFLNCFLSYALKLCIENGLAVRSVQILCKWIFINLQMEYLQKAEIKMQFVECILELREAKELPTSLKAIKSCAMSASKELQNGDENVMDLMNAEMVRKVATMTIRSPIKHENNSIPITEFDHKLKNCSDTPDSNKNTTKRLSHVVLWCHFTLSCLKARFNFLSSEYKDLGTFYENCQNWLEKRSQTIHYQFYQSTVFICMIHHANFLRANKNYEKATKQLNTYIEYCASQEGRMDITYLLNLELQLQDTKLEEIENISRCLRTKKKINFISLTKSNEIKTTPIAKPIKSKHISMTTQKMASSSLSSKTLKTADFVIYSEKKSPRKAKVTQTISLAAKKSLAFDQNISDMGSSGSEKENLDTCQFIEINDSDCEFEIDGPKSVVSKPKEKLQKTQHQQKAKFKFMDSVELADYETPKTVEATAKRSTKNKIRQKTVSPNDVVPTLVDELQNIAIESISSTTKTRPKLHRSHNMDKKINNAPVVLPIPCIAIDSESEQSPPILSNAVSALSTRATRKNNTEQSKKSSESSSSIEGGARRRLPARQARLENPIETIASTMSLRRRQRN